MIATDTSQPVTRTDRELDTWWKQIEETPEDWDLRRVFADWLEDQGSPELNVLANGQRWQAEHKRRAGYHRGVEGGPNYDGHSYDWVNYRDWAKNEQCYISPNLIYVTENKGGYHCASYLEFSTRREGEIALAEALDELKAKGEEPGSVMS